MNALLLRGAMEGHEPAWSALFRAHHEKTVQWLVRRIRARLTNLTIREATEPAEEAVQEAWLAIVARGVTPTDAMPGLLMRIAIRAFWLAHRRRAAASVREGQYAAVGRNTASLTTGATAALSILDVAGALTDARLDAWVLRHVYEMSLKEVADELGLAHAHAAAAVLSKAHASLR